MRSVFPFRYTRAQVADRDGKIAAKALNTAQRGRLHPQQLGGAAFPEYSSVRLPQRQRDAGAFLAFEIVARQQRPGGGMSSRRSRRGGTSMGKTLSR